MSNGTPVAAPPPATFADLGLGPALLRAVHDQGFVEPAAIQAAAIPPALQGRDVLGRSPTGSGKTAAFALPVLQRVLATRRGPPDRPMRPRGMPTRRPQALVLVPTRDLALQVGDTLQALAAHGPRDLKLAVVFGGVSVNPQMLGLRGGADIVVATPGRLLDLVERNALRLDDVGLLVLDEADRLLDEGFGDELTRIVALLPTWRQTLMFSATFTPPVRALAAALLHDPVTAEPADATAAQGRPAIRQRAIEVDAARRTPLLRHLIVQEGWSRVLVFVATRYATEHVADKLRRGGISAAAFHGELSQGARSGVLADLRSGALQVVVATDMAARGLHIAELPVVVNHDLPRSPADHIHRIGRTARAGRAGLAVSFVDRASEAHFRLIEKRQGERVPRERVPGFEPTQAPVETPAQAALGTGGVKGRRPSRKDKLRAAVASRQGERGAGT